MSLVTYTYEMDLDNDGVYETDISAYVLECRITRGRWRGEERYLAGEAVLTLDNSDGRFHNRNTASPYYGSLRPGVKVRIRAHGGDDLVTDTTGTLLAADGALLSTGISSGGYDLYNGLLVEINAIGRDTVQVITQDLLGYMRDVKVSGSLLQNALTGAVVEAYLDEVGIGTSERNVDAGVTTIAYAHISGTLSQVLHEVANAEQGRVYVTKDGKVRFEDRHWRLKPAQQTSVWTLQDQNPIADMESPIGWEFLRNRITVTAHPVEIKATSVLWQSETVISVEPGATREVWAQFSDPDTENPCAGKDVVAPAAGTDYVANTKEDGTGSDITSSVSVSMSAFADTAKLTITNNGSQTAYLTTLQVRGKPVVERRVTVRQEDSSSIAAYRLREKRLSPRLLQDVDVAENMARFLLGMLNDPQRGPITLIIPIDSLSLPTALNVEISQRITVTSGTHYISAQDFYVEGIEYQIVNGEQQQPDTLTIYAEPADMLGGWFVVDYARAGETTRLAY